MPCKQKKINQHAILDKQPDRYCFAQQQNNACHLLSFLNLSILKRLRQEAAAASNGEIDLNDCADQRWHTKREWMPITFIVERQWQDALKRLIDKKDGVFAKYQEQNFIDGVILGKMFLPSGKSYFSASWYPITNIERRLGTAHSAMIKEYLDEDAQNVLYANSREILPILYDGQNILLYKTPTEIITLYQEPIDATYRSMQEQYTLGFVLIETAESKIVYCKVTKEILDFLGLEDKAIIEPVINVLGAKQGFCYHYLPDIAKSQTYYSSSLYKLMLLALGVDIDGNTINEQHSLWSIFQEISKDNPWKFDAGIFKKENLLEYHLASLFKVNSELKRLARSVVDCYFHSMQYYEELDGLYDSPDPNNRQSLKDKKAKHLPCEELMLAYYFAGNLHSLWAAAKGGSSTLNAILETNEIPGISCANIIPGFPTATKLLRGANIKHGKYSLLEVWQILKEQLLEQLQGNMDLVSFSGHGKVISFSDDILELQNNHSPIFNKSIMNKLGFAIIDSYYGQKLVPFYKKSSAVCSDEGNLPLIIKNYNQAKELCFKKSLPLKVGF